MSKKRIKDHVAARKAGWESNEPKIDKEDYRATLSAALSFYNSNITDETKQKWVIAHWKAQGKNVAGYDKMDAGRFRQAAVLARLLKNQQYVDPKHVAFLDNKYSELATYNKVESQLAPKKEEVKKPNIQDRITELAQQHTAEFDAAIDDFCSSGKAFDAKAYLSSNEVKAPIAAKIAASLKPQISEFERLLEGEDPQLVEGYSNFSKPKQKRILAFLKECLTACETMAVIAKTMRKPRARKEKPAGVLVSKMKYMREMAEFKLKSIDPAKIVGSTEVWLFNAKIRKLIKYTALDGMMLSVRGNTLLNIDPEKSGAKTLRKPAIQLADIGSLSKRPLTALYKEIKSVEGKVNGRMNDQMVIINAFI